MATSLQGCRGPIRTVASVNGAHPPPKLSSAQPMRLYWAILDVEVHHSTPNQLQRERDSVPPTSHSLKTSDQPSAFYAPF